MPPGRLRSEEQTPPCRYALPGATICRRSWCRPVGRGPIPNSAAKMSMPRGGQRRAELACTRIIVSRRGNGGRSGDRGRAIGAGREGQVVRPPTNCQNITKFARAWWARFHRLGGSRCAGCGRAFSKRTVRPRIECNPGAGPSNFRRTRESGRCAVASDPWPLSRQRRRSHTSW
jgi:hypothetical protein